MVEPAADEPAGPAARAGDLEADDTSTRPHRAAHLGKAAPIVGQVAHAEGDRGSVERPVLDGQAQRVADHERQPRASDLGPGELDHPGRDIDPDHRAARRDGAVERGGDLARPDLIRSVRQYPSPQRIVEIMHEAGLSRVRWFGLLGGIVTIHVGIRTDRESNADAEGSRAGSEAQDRGAASSKTRANREH